MLRAAVLVVGTLGLLAGLVALERGEREPALWLLLNGVVLTAGVVWERWRYRPTDSTRPPSNWQATGESFVDPETGKLTEVYYEPKTGERRYVAAGSTGN